MGAWTKEKSDQIYSATKRQREIQGFTKETPHRWQNPLDDPPQNHELDVYTVPIEFPSYRLSNRRTESQQSTYVHRNNTTDSFFKDNESKEAQWVQHNILINMVNGEGGEVVKRIGLEDKSSLIEEEINKTGQTEPLMMIGCFTSNPKDAGIILNGNRRLATLRHKGNTSVKVFILPPSITTEEQFREIEEHLQQKVDAKSEYNWVNQCKVLHDLHYQKLNGHKENFTNYVDKKLSMKYKEAKLMVDMYDEIKKYLDFIQKQGDYGVVSETNRKQLFIDIVNKTTNRLNHKTKEEIRHAAYATMYNQYEPTGISINKTLNNLEKVLRDDTQRKKLYDDEMFDDIKPPEESNAESMFDSPSNEVGTDNNSPKEIQNFSRALYFSGSQDTDDINKKKETLDNFVQSVNYLSKEMSDSHDKDRLYNRLNEIETKFTTARDLVKQYLVEQSINSSEINFDKKKVQGRINKIKKLLDKVQSYLDKN